MLLFTTSLRVKDLRLPGFYKIDTLDTAEGVGYQRLLNETRAKRLADYLLDAHTAREAFLPTSLLLATDKVLPFDEANSTLTIDTERNPSTSRFASSGLDQPSAGKNNAPGG